MNDVPHPTRLLAAVLGLVALAFAAAIDGEGARAAAPPLRLNLTASRVLEVITAGGTHIRTSSAPGAVIPPGTYSATISTEVGDAEDTHHMFHLSGPGQNLQTDLLGGDSPTELFVLTLLPSSVYVFEDDRNPQLGRVVFSTSGAGTAVADTGSSGGGGASASSGTTTTEKSRSANNDVVGSKVVRFRGILAGGVSTTAKLSLTFKGKKVSSLKSGRYRIAVLDETARGAFTLQRLGRQPVTVSTRAFVGKHTVTLSLRAGQWMFFSSPHRKSYFIVVS